MLTGLVMLIAVRVEAISFGGLSFSVADVAALGALAAVLLALARGKASATSLAGGGTGVVLLLLPGLVLFVLAVAVARVLAPALRALERVGRHGPPSLRLALLSLARSPGRVLLSVVFFVLSVGVALFAIAYRPRRSSAVRPSKPATRFRRPSCSRRTSSGLVPIQAAATLAQYAPLGAATQVLRDSGYVTAARGIDFTLLALPAGALPRVDGWRPDSSSQSLPTLSRAR